MNNESLICAFKAFQSGIIKDKTVYPIAGSLVESLVKQIPATDYSLHKRFTQSDQNTDLRELVKAVQAHLNSSQDEYISSLDSYLSAKVDLIAQVVSQHFVFVKNIINPICRQFVAEYDALTQAPIEPREQFVFHKVAPNPLLDNTSIVEELHHLYGNKVSSLKEKPVGQMSLPQMTFAQVCEVIARDNPETMTAVLDYLQSLGEYVVMGLLSDVYGWQSMYVGNMFDISNDTDRSTVYYLFAKSMFDKPLEGTQHTLGQFNARMTNERVYHGHRLVSLYCNDTAMLNRSQRVVSNYNPQTKTVYLYAPAYDKYLSSGGDDLKLLGCVVSNLYKTDVCRYSNLIARSEEMARHWNSFEVAEKSKNDAKASTRAREAFVFCATKLYNDNKISVKEYCLSLASIDHPDAENAQHLAQSMEDQTLFQYKRFVTEKARTYTDHMLCEPTRLVLDLIGHMFPGSPAYAVLSIAQDVEINNGDYDEEKILQATLYKYVCDYWFSQLYVSS